MGKLEKYLLKDIAVSQTGPFGSQLHEKDYVQDGTPIVTVEHLGEIGFYLDNLPMVSDKDKARLSKYTLKEGDIVFSRVGSIDRCTYVSKKEDGWLFSGRCLRVRFNEKADPKYVSYYFRQKHFKEMMLNISVGATMPSLNTSLMDNIPLFLPSKDTQQEIAAVLSALDAKIELNQRINTVLESIAKLVFRYWFVENKEKAKWETGTLGIIAENIRRSANPNDIKPETYYIGLEHMPRKSIVLAEYGNASELESNKYAFKAGEFLFGKLRPYFHKVGIAPVDGVCSTDILVVAPKSPEYYGFVLGHISSDEIIKYADATSGGTKMPRTNWESLAKFEVSMPPVELAKEFTEFFVPIARQIRNNILESQTLMELRDWLLPMLMNGQVRVA